MRGTNVRGIILNQTQQRQHDWSTLEDLEDAYDAAKAKPRLPERFIRHDEQKNEQQEV